MLNPEQKRIGKTSEVAERRERVRSIRSVCCCRSEKAAKPANKRQWKQLLHY